MISQNEEVLSPKIAKAEKGKKIAENRLNELSIAKNRQNILARNSFDGKIGLIHEPLHAAI